MYNKLSRRAAAGCASALLVGSALAGCASDSDGDGPIKLALVGPLTGDAASYGLEVQNGINLAVDQINEDGGIDGREIEIDTFDDKCSPTDGATAANSVVGGDYVAVVGQVCSVAVASSIPIYKRHDIPIVAAAASSPSLADLGYEGFNRVIPADDLAVSNALTFATGVMDYKRVGVLYSSDDYGQSLAEVVKSAVGEQGAEAVAMETYTSGQTNDYSPMLANIAKADPDVFFLGGYDADMGAAVKQSARVFGDQEIPIVSNNNVQTANFLELAGDAGEGTTLATVYAPENTFPGNEEFVTAYQEANDGNMPGTQAAMGYQSIQVLAAAIEANDGKTDDLFDALRDTSLSGIIGDIAFNENGDNVAASVAVVRAEGGEWVYEADLTDQLSQLISAQ